MHLNYNNGVDADISQQLRSSARQVVSNMQGLSLVQ